MGRAPLLLFFLFLSSGASALQTLVPTPYPSGAPGASPLDPETQDGYGPQDLLRDPYPQILGDAAPGNPPIARRHRRQHLVPSANERKYKVDRPPTMRP